MILYTAELWRHQGSVASPFAGFHALCLTGLSKNETKSGPRLLSAVKKVVDAESNHSS